MSLHDKSQGYVLRSAKREHRSVESAHACGAAKGVQKSTEVVLSNAESLLLNSFNLASIRLKAGLSSLLVDSFSAKVIKISGDKPFDITSIRRSDSS